MLSGMLVVLEEMFLFFREMVKHLASGLSNLLMNLNILSVFGEIIFLFDIATNTLSQNNIGIKSSREMRNIRKFVRM